MSNEMHPEILEGLDWEAKYVKQNSTGQRRELKLARGDSWLIRYLPAQLGPNKRFYARVGKHWFNKRAIVCPRHTEEAFGGDPNAYCAVCELTERLNNDRNEEVSQLGFKARGTASWITYCAVFQKAVNGGNAQDLPTPEVLQPYQHVHFRSTWDELVAFVRAGTRRSALSVLDFEKGNDFYVTKTAKGIRLDKQDSAPIFDLADPKFDEYTAKLLAACKDPQVKIPQDQQLDDFADKIQEEADNLAHKGSRGPRRQENNRDEDDLPPEDHAPRGRRAAPEQEPEDAQPARRSVRQQPAETSPEDAQDQEVAPSRQPVRRAQATDRQAHVEAEQEQEQEQEQEAAPEPRQQRPVTRPSAIRRDPPPAPARRAEAPPASRGGGTAQESLDPDEDLPEETVDQAPPEPLVGSADDAGAETEAPPVVSRRGSFGTAIKSRIAAANNSARK